MRKFMRTREHAAPPAGALHGHALKTNGHTNGVGVQRDELHSALSRYWSGSESGAALFEDACFPATWRALGDRRLAAGVRWMRPHELCARPRFRGDERAGRERDAPSPARSHTGADHDDDDDDDPDRWVVAAGALPGAAVCAAAAALAGAPRLLARALRSHRAGAARFQFWVFGSWREVVVDDRLPTRGGRVVCARSARCDDFTLPLLHKAYAKLHGSFAALRGAGVARALQDLTGAVVQSFSLRRQPHALTFQVLNSAVPRSTLLVATLLAEDAKRAPSGLLAGQAYCVTGMARVREAGGAGTGALLLLRAAGARGLWAGAWAPHSAEWRALAPPDRELLAERVAQPGDFWMSFGDFATSFSSLELVHVGPDDWLREPALHARRPWRAVLARRRWLYGYNAGGPPSSTETTGTNPQFHVQIPRTEAGGARKCHVVVSVTQQYDAVGGPRPRAIGFCVYELPPGAAPRRDLHPLRGLRALDVTHESRAREVVTFFTLPAGRYLVVPHTRRAHTEGAFLLRILTDEHTDVWELNEDNVIVRDLRAELRSSVPPAELRRALARLEARADAAGELDAVALRGALRAEGRAASGALCRALVALGDGALAGAAPAVALAALLALLGEWRSAFRRAGARRCGAAASSYRLRALLWASGVTASNKVLEGVVRRFARRARLSEDAFLTALARLHLAHERYRSLDARLKSNPLTLEEMILMTIYS